MAEATADIEKAPSSHIGNRKQDDKTQLPRVEPKTEVDDAKNIEAEKVVVLSFRGLQLRRISELQDELLHLAVISATGLTETGASLPDNHKNVVDKALREYGTFCLISEAICTENKAYIGK